MKGKLVLGVLVVLVTHPTGAADVASDLARLRQGSFLTGDDAVAWAAAEEKWKTARHGVLRLMMGGEAGACRRQGLFGKLLRVAGALGAAWEGAWEVEPC
eukprot:Sspe_Gene.21679::Locus_8144_Transcript_1_2_Confidence_0.667_Length_1134::g.21679::m.21679